MLKVTSFGRVTNPWRDDYVRRIQKMTSFVWQEIALRPKPDARPPQLLKEEKTFLAGEDSFWILDPEGKLFSFQDWRKLLLRSGGVHLVVGPAVGFHPDFRSSAKGAISLSPLAFTHELSQVILAESLYRVFCAEMNHPFVK